MRKLLLAAALIASPAWAISPVTPPESVRVDIVDEQVCTGVQRELREHVRNIYANRRAFNTVWWQNSRGEYLAFDCYYSEWATKPYTLKHYSVIYVTDQKTIEAEIERERESLKQSLKEKQDAVRRSGYN